MEENEQQQEIIFVATSSLGKRSLCEKDPHDGSPNESNTEKLERACWNGLIEDFVPEAIGESTGKPRLFLWSVRQLEHTLLIEMGTSSPTRVKEYSINPNLFVVRGIFN